MTGVDSWSTTALTNSTADGGNITWAEGQMPSTVNDSARQVLADLRAYANGRPWFQYGTGDQGSGNLAVPGVYASSTSFTIAGVDVTAVYHAGRRVKAVGSSTGTIYGSISSSSFSTNTTVNVTWDSGSLSNETLTISISDIPVTGLPVPTTALSGSITVANGGTGRATLTAHGVLIGNGTGQIVSTGLGTTTQVLHGNATGDPAYAAVSLTADVSGTLPVANGGTGNTTAAGALVTLGAAASGANSDITSISAASWAGALKYSGAAIISDTISADQNNYNPTGLSTAYMVRIDGGVSSRNITGLTAPATTRDIVIVNVGTSSNIVIKNNSASSSSANKFHTTSAADVTLASNGGMIRFTYDTALSNGWWQT